MAEPILVANAVTKQFFRKGRESAQHFDAVSQVQISLVAGEFVVLMGRSGSGKSTLGQMLVGLIRPDEGRNLRLMAPKYPLEYIQKIEKTCADKAQIADFYHAFLRED